MNNKLSIMGLPRSMYLVERLAAALGIEDCITPLNVGTYPGGELHVHVESNDRSFIDGREVILVGCLDTNEELLAFYLAAFNLLNKGVKELSLVIPYCMYGTQEREVLPNEAVAAQAIATLLSNLPRSSRIRIYMLDLHTSGLRHYFHKGCTPEEVYGGDALQEAILSRGLANYAVGSGDLGRPKWIKAYAKNLGVHFVFVDKDHIGDGTITSGFLGDIEGVDVGLYDDLTHSGKTAIQALQLYLENRATGGFLILSHFAVNNEEVIDMLEASKFKWIFITDSCAMSQHPKVQASSKFVVVPIMPSFAARMRPALERRGVL
ncbi:MAG TPA: ribose-phosphate pyrophosphokinase-like domain-containing protein [Verrucomicrobiae bacterium]|nr:ribose-phosphate pyrophosphokinase-like domain-containing protein [Verrucomicrobiae bacterium]